MKFHPSARATALIFVAFIGTSLSAHGQSRTQPVATAPSARPQTPFVIADSIWSQIEASEAYRNLPQPKPVRVVFQSTVDMEYTGSVSRTLPKAPTTNWRTTIDITPVSDKCTRRRTETMQGSQRTTVDNYVCGAIPLGMVMADLNTRGKLERVEAMEGSLFPLRVGNRQKLVFVTNAAGALRQSSECEVVSQVQARDVDPRLEGSAWKLQCHVSIASTGFNKDWKVEDYYLEDLSLQLSEIGQFDTVRNSSVMPSSGTQTAIVADGPYGSRTTTTYASYDWTAGQAAAAAPALAAPSPPPRQPTLAERLEARKQEEARNMTPEQAAYARQQQQMQQEMAELRERLLKREELRAQQAQKQQEQQQAQQQSASSGPGFMGGLLGGVASRVMDRSIAKVNAAAGGSGPVGNVLADVNSRIANEAKDKIANDMGSTQAGRAGLNVASALTAGAGGAGGAGGGGVGAPGAPAVQSPTASGGNNVLASRGSPAAAAPPQNGTPVASANVGECVKFGAIGNRDGMLPECYKGKQNTFGWGATTVAACEGAQRGVKNEFQGTNPSGCYCKANARVNSVVQPFVCWVMFD